MQLNIPIIFLATMATTVFAAPVPGLPSYYDPVEGVAHSGDVKRQSCLPIRSCP